MEKFNLIVTTRRGEESEACSEVWSILRDLGDDEPVVERSPVSGLIFVWTRLNPFEVVEKFREILRRSPWELRYTNRVIPIERNVPTDIQAIKQAVMELVGKIAPGETFRVTVEKRFTNLRSMDIIRAVAEDVDRKVDLENPDKIILVEVVGKVTGVSVLRPSDVLSVKKELREPLKP